MSLNTHVSHTAECAGCKHGYEPDPAIPRICVFNATDRTKPPSKTYYCVSSEIPPPSYKVLTQGLA